LNGSGFNFEGVVMKKPALALLVVMFTAGVAFSQGKGVDKQSERVRDSGSGGTPANNGTKRDVGAGRGIDFGKGKTPVVPKLNNPYRFTGRRDVIIKAIQEVMRDRKLIMDEAASKSSEGIIVSQPFRFIKGTVVAAAELGRYSNVPTLTGREWTQGRYTITVEVQPIDGVSSNVSVNAKIEGRTDGATGPEWLTLPSLGVAEDDFLAALIEKMTGTLPPGHAPTVVPSEKTLK
jgi:hypothetical protein